MVLGFLAVGGPRCFGCLRGRIHLVRALPLLVELVTGGRCLAAVGGGLLLQTGGLGRLDVGFGLGSAGLGGGLVGQCFALLNLQCFVLGSVGFVRWIVDALNVIGTRPDGWWKNHRPAMVGLADQLERWASAEGHHVTAAFERPTLPPILSSPVIEIGQAPKAAANSAIPAIGLHLMRAR